MSDISFIREWVKEKKSKSADIHGLSHLSPADPIVITGVSGFFPGCMDVRAFWNCIDRDESLITEIPQSRFDWNQYYDSSGSQQGKMRTKLGGFIPDIASFDSRFFNILPVEAAEIDPRQRLLLTSTWHTLEDAGVNPLSLKQSRTGVFIGCETNEYAQLMRSKGAASTGLLNNADSMLANRISYFFDFSGPSEYINTMCSSFAVALHRAVMSVRSGQIDRAIVGAANIALLPEPFIILSQEGLLSTQNTVKSFGKEGNGYLRSEGAGTILIERFSDAKKAHRHIYAVIKQTNVNYNGQGGMSIAAPNTAAHTKLIKDCYQEANIDPRRLSYIEAQGMGLPVADIAEWTAFNRALTELCQEAGHAIVPGYCRVSTLKPMTGHMHAASALGALLKIIRSFHTKKIHKVLNFSEPNPFCDMDNTPCRIVRETESWEDRNHMRLAALHSYGVGGNNAHILLEEYQQESFPIDCRKESQRICLSARTPEQLNKMIRKLHDYLVAAPETDLIRLSFTLNTGRAHFPYRCAWVADSIEDLILALKKATPNCAANKEKELMQMDMLYPKQGLQSLPGLPGYPFEKSYCWFEEGKSHFNKDGASLGEMIQTALGVGREDLHTPFAELGIDSLSAARMIVKLESTFNIRLHPSDMFNYPTISEMQKHIASLVPQNSVQKHPLSEGQKGLWTLQKTFPEMTAYNVPLCFRISDLLIHIEKFKQACQFLLKQHPILNSVIRNKDGELYQLILPSQDLFFQQHDFCGMAFDQVQARLNQIAKQVFILEEGPLIRIHVAAVTAKEAIVLINIHHIVFDGGSVAIFIKTLFDAYQALINNKIPQLLVESVTFDDFVREEQQMLIGKEGKLRLEYWQQQLSGNLPVLNLLTDRPRSSLQNAFAGKTHSHVLSQDMSKHLKQFSKSQQTYLSTAFLSIFKILLHKYTGQKDIIVGMPISERSQKYLKQAIGFFINMIPIRSEISENESFLKFLNKLQRTIFDAMAHSYPFPALVRELNISNTSGRAPVFQAAFMYQDFLEETPIDFVEGIHQEGEYEIVLEVIEKKTDFVLNWKYNPELFDESTIAWMTKHYIKLLTDMTTGPNAALDRYSMLNEEEETLFLAWNDTQTNYPKHICFHELFEAQALKSPDATAVIFEGESLTYSQLDRKSTELAKYLQAAGVTANGLVAICVERSLDMIIGLLGIHKAGAAYVPLDPTYPAERLAYMIEDSQAKWIITQSGLKEKILALRPGPKTAVIILDEEWAQISQKAQKIEKQKTQTDDLAYVIYTSGSTGNPKGVMISHLALTNFLLSMAQEPGLQQNDKLLAVTTYCFDIAGLELFLPLIKGAQCCISNTETAKNVEMLKKLIRQFKPTIMQATPSTWTMLFHAGWNNEEKIKILCGGEALPESLKQHFIKTNSQVWNVFGPTETTIWSTLDKIEKDKPITVGKPIANTQVYILRLDQLCPIGIPGELCIAGDGLAKGYFNKPELTSASFVDNPFNPGSKLYRTKDLARWLPEGKIQHLGRMDFQVKINGFRIELSEIETQLNSHASIKESTVVVKEQENSKQLVAYYVPTKQENDLPEKLRNYLSEKLPAYMMPAFFIALDQLPLTPNGKIDRKALMHRDIILQKEASHTLPESEIEKEVLALWEAVLKIQNISTADGFFEAGGNSVTAVILSERISKHFNIPFAVTNVFKYSTIRKISQHIHKELHSEAKEDGTREDSRDNSSESMDLKKPYPDYYQNSLAIIGISCHFPGAKNHYAFWQNLKDGKESAKFFTKEELREAKVPEEIIQDPHYVPMQLTIDGKELFDPAFFNLSSKNAAFMDPQFRQLLLHSWKAVEDAGYVPREIPDTSVFMSVSNSYYQTLLQNSHAIDPSDEYAAWILAQGGTIPSMISYQLGLRGPSIFVHTNCSSSLSALSLAYQSLQLHDAKYALVGASTLFSSPEIGYVYRPGLNFSSDGRCKAFDAAADGLIPGEGVAVLVVKRVLDAIADGDHIYALLRSVGLNNDGSDKAGFYAPGVSGQVEVIQKVLDKTDVNPVSISYVEAHGTGTSLGDPIEVSALTEAYQQYTSQKRYCALGSVKPNIGHLDTSAGLAGCIKVALCLKNKEIPASINYTKPNPKINFEDSPFYVVDHLQAWPQGATPRRAALNSLGIGGTNAHAILEEYVETENRIEVASAAKFLLPLSAKNSDRLYAYAETLLIYLKSQKETPNLGDLSFTFQIGREAMEKRVIFIVHDLIELIENLENFVNKKTNIKNCFQGEAKKVDFFEDDEDAQELIHKWLQKGKTEKLAKLWVKGGDIDWKLLYPGRKPQRISAPTYPFAEERYWADARNSQSNSPNIATLLFKPIWKEVPAASSADRPAYASHRVFLCGLKQLEISFTPLPSKHFVDNATALFDHIQAILAERPREPVLVQIVVPDKGPERLYTSISGLLKSAHLENPKIFGQVIMVDSEITGKELIGRLQENSKAPDEPQIRYKQDKRFVMRFEEETHFKEEQNPWRDNGIYLITGGAGGLGLLFAKEIAAQTKHATVVIAGRSKLTPKKKARLEELERLGVKLVYKEADVCDKASLEKLVDEIKELGELKGIIHSAGIIKDNFILKKSKAEFAQVLLPKVQGAIHLDEATQHLEHLDFFVLFSSVAGAMGNAGQADYATANAFLDAFAEERQSLCDAKKRSGQTLSINWPLWKAGGMSVDQATQEVMKDNIGMTPMETASGIKAFYRALSLKWPQVIVMEGVPEKIKSFIHAKDATVETASTSSDKIDLKILRENTLAQLKILIGDVLKISVSKIDPDEALEIYGIDSIAIIQLNQKLKSTFTDISHTLFFEYQTLAALCDYLVHEYPQACMKWTGLKIADAQPIQDALSMPTLNKHVENPIHDPIAIIGTSVRFPQARDLDEYWHNLKSGRDSIVTIPNERWPLQDFYCEDMEEAIAEGKSYCKWGGFLEGFADFDPLFFGISPRESMNMDPQERIFLQSCWTVLEDAGYTKKRIAAQHDGNVGVFAGITKTGFALYAPEMRKRKKPFNPQTSFSSVANRVSYAFDLKGPSLAIDTMCSSSLTAIHEACEHLQRNECEMAIAGGVNLYLHPSTYVDLCALRMLSINGQCKSFGAEGNGFVPGEGVGVVLLKKLSEAIRDKDHIYAVIRCTHVNHGGKTNGYTVPNPKSQKELVRGALDKAKINARTLSYLEAHGTGTELGDPIEITGLTQAFQEDTSEKGFCSIGSAKSNIGHLEAAAGIAGVAKILLQMKYKMLVPSLHAAKLNPNIDFDKTPFVVQQQCGEWRRPVIDINGTQKEYPRMAGVSSFGAGGSNAHVIIEEYQVDDSPLLNTSLPIAITLSAKNAARLTEYAENLLKWMQGHPEINLADLAYTFQIGREPMEERLGLIIHSKQELEEKLDRFIRNEANISNLFRGQANKGGTSVSENTDAWIKERKYEKLLELWVKGGNFDWSKLYENHTPQRISAPTYPFAKDRYWVENVNHADIKYRDPSLIRLISTDQAFGIKQESSPVSLIDDGDGIFSIQVANDLNQSAIVRGLEKCFAAIREKKNAKAVLLKGIEQSENEARNAALLPLECDIPVIAVVKGRCIGLGWLIASLCDFMICSEESSCQYLSPKPSEEELFLFEERFGKEFASELLLSGQTYSGIDLRKKGLGMPILPKDEIDSYALKFALQLAAAPRLSLTLLKKHLSQEIAHRAKRLVSSSTPISNDRKLYDLHEENDLLYERLEAIAGNPKTIKMTSDVVSLHAYENGVVVIAMSDKENKNTFSNAFVQGVMEAFEKIEKSSEYKAVILTGYGHYFACGGTKEGLLSIQKGESKFTDSMIYSLPMECKIPVIAAMQGHGIGAGWSMGMYCDYVLFSKESVYLSPYMRYGFTPGAGSTLVFPKKFGKDLGREILFTAKEYKADELSLRGIKHPLLSRADMQEYALGMASKIALSSREELIKQKAQRCADLRNRIGKIYDQELAMHEKSFVNNEEVFQRIQSNFNEMTPATPAETVPEFQNDRGNMSKAIRETLRTTLAEELHMNKDLIDDDLAFIDMGLDSIIGVTWVRKINTEYGLSIPATKVYSHPTIAQFTTYVMDECKNHGTSLPKDILPAHGISDNSKAKETRNQTCAIAVIGMSGEFPKSKTLEEFWDNLKEGRDCISAIPTTRWDVSKYYDPDPQAAGKTHCKWMGALEDAAQFDPLFFNISPTEAELMDPQQRVFLQSIWHCIEDAAYSPSQLSGTRCAVFVGCGTGDYGRLLENEELSAKGFTGSSTSILAARISYLLNLQGPCISIDTACSSSLVAISLACDSLVLGNSDMALAGGVCVLAGPSVHIMSSKSGMLSENGRCYCFDQRANGFVPGEGVGAVFLKRLEDAERDGDHIHAVIRGWGVNQDGKTNGITAPNPDAQARLEKEIYEKYGINPESIQLVETHGTGTKLGDPIEVEGLQKSFKAYTSKENYCALGSVKSNVGHLLTAAGIAGTIKLLLSLKHKKIPPTIHHEQLNEHIDLKKTPFYINTKCIDWPRSPNQKRRCAISSFGFSGTNAHVVFEEYITENRQTHSSHPAIIALSAKNRERLTEYAKSLLKFIQSNPSINLSDLAYTFQVGREAMQERLAVIVSSSRMLLEKLQQFVEGKEEVDNLYLGQAKQNPDASTNGSNIETLIAKGKYSDLVNLWVKGFNIDWNRLYASQKPQKISAPIYPFAKEHYWGISKTSPEMHIHPLLHENTSTVGAERFSSMLTGREFFLRDHQVQNQKILPGVVYLEMAQAALSHSLPKDNKHLALKNVVWARPLAVVKPTKITIALFPAENGEANYEIYTEIDGSSPLIYSKGMGLLCPSKDATRLNIPDLQAKLNKRQIDRQTCYEAFSAMGLDYGPAHQGIEKIYVGEKAVLAKLSLPSFLANAKSQFTLHPSLLDSALQASIGLSFSGEKQKSPLALPFALERIDILHPCTESMWAWVRYSEGRSVLSKVLKLDIDLCDENGLVCVAMRGFTSRIMEPVFKEDLVETAVEAPSQEPDEKALEQKVIAYFKKLLAKVLKIPIQQIQASDPFEKYGVDSIMVMQLTAELEKDFGSLSKTLFFEYLTIQEMSAHFLTSYRSTLLKILDFNSSKQITSLPARPSLPFQQSRSEENFINPSFPQRAHIDIAITGLSGKYPQSENLEEFWHNLRDGKDCIIEIPKERWDWKDYYTEDRSIPGRHYSKWGGFITDADKFDPLFFNISPREAELIDPQERLFLEYVWMALEDAGYKRNDLQEKLGGKAGVYAAIMYSHYQLFGAEENARGNPVSLGNSYASIANRVSYFLNLHGPSMTVDTMCSSSLTAMHLACQDLKLGHINLGIVGGVNLSIHPNKYLDLSAGQFISSKGRCESFGEGGEGYIPGEGVGVALLKRLFDAERDGDHIYGVIKGSMLNHGGKTNGYTVPNPNAQQEAIEGALAESQINSKMISYVEAHGTGTKLGDPIEITGLSKAFAFNGSKPYCWIGSAKSNIGHCESAAGIAGVTKVLLQMKNGEIAPSLHSKTLNPNIDFSKTPFIVNQQLRDWPRPVIDGKEYPRIAGISSFGAGGSNAHIIIEEYTGVEDQTAVAGPVMIVLSARNRARLMDYAKRLLKFIQENPKTNLADLAYTLQVGREAMNERLGLIISSMQMLEEKLQEFIAGIEDAENLYLGQAKQNAEMLAVFTTDDDVVDIVDKWIAKGKYGELLNLWVKGLNCDWSRLYSETKPRRISAPTYPFAKERYWVEAKGTALTTKSEIGILIFKPAWKASPVDSDGASLQNASHQVFLCGLKQSPEQLKAENSGISFSTLPANQKGFVDYSVALFEHIQKLITEKPKNPVLLQVVVPDQGPERLYSALSGLLKSAHLENPKIVGQVIMVNPECTGKELLDKLQECSKTPQEQQIHYHHGNRFVMRYAEETNFQEKQIPWKDNGVYLITGGAGGLGLLFATEIASKTQHATLVITGRSKLTPQKKSQLEELKNLGIKIEYKEVDVCDKASVKKLIHEITHEMGELNGIIHSAGIIKDNFILKKNKAEFTQVLLPKVEGAVNLDEATQDLKHLDFFILFSSGAGVTGNIGQADYATGNAFLDAFAHERQSLCNAQKRSGQTLSINWPLWRDGGMRVNQATEQMMKESSGMVPMETASGMAAFYLAVSLKQPQVGVVEGNLRRLREKLFMPVEPQNEEAPSVEKDHSNRSNASLSKIQHILLQTVSELLKIKPADIDVKTELSEYGFDSVSLTEFSNKLNQKYKLELTPTIFFEYPTLESFANHLITEHQSVFARLFPPDTQPAAIPVKKSMAEAPILETKGRTAEPIAIVGMSGQFPMAKDIDDFWHNLENEKSCIKEIPKERWDWEKLYGDPKTELNKTNIKWGGFIDGIAEFDPLFFNISPREAELMDPQQRLLMTYAWRALEDSGHSALSLSGTNTGVFVGTASSGYSDLIAKAKSDNEGYSSTGTVASIGPNRMSYFLNIHGPSEPIETACSSSLVAIHRAVLAIEAGECDQAIVGGINTIITPEAHISFNKAGMLSQDGRCKTFSKHADGYVRSEGVGMLVLKKLNAAEADGDHIYGLIRGSAQNHGGRANSLTAPNPKAQTDLIVNAYKKAGIDPKTIGYIEVHGTGTALGDPIEINGLKAAFKKLYLETENSQIQNAHCGLGSVKTNIGHLEIAAGVSGVIKVLLQLKHKKMVKSLYCDDINPYIDLADSPFYLVQQSQEWNPLQDSNGKTLPRRAGVSSFGFGGSNAHIVIEEYIPKGIQKLKATASPVIVVLSAKTSTRLSEYAENLLKFVQSSPEVDLVGLAYTFQVGRDAMEERLGFIIHSKQELEEKLRHFIEKKTDISNLYRGQVKQNKEALAIFTEDEDMAKTIDAWMAKGKYDKLLELWVKGFNLDWNKLYKNDKPQRISAPTYPFSKESYWITNSVDQTKEEKCPPRPAHVETIDWTRKIEAKKGHRILVISDDINDYEDLKNNCQTLSELSQSHEPFCHLSYQPAAAFKPEADSPDAIFLFLPKIEGLKLASSCIKSIKKPIQFYCCYPKQESNAFQDGLKTLFAGDLHRYRGIAYDEKSQLALRLMQEWLSVEDDKKKYVLEKRWKQLDISSANTMNFNGPVLVLVNEASSALAHSLIEISALPKSAQVIDFQNNKGTLHNTKKISYLIDLSDLYLIAKDRDSQPYEKIDFYQKILSSTDSELNILYLTKGLQPFQSKEMSLAGAKFAGLIKMLGVEYRHVRSIAIDIDESHYQGEMLAKIVRNELQAAHNETEICYRESGRFVPYVHKTEMDRHQTAPTITQKGVYVISGGTGGIGLKLADYLVEKGARFLVLMGKTSLPPKGEWKSIQNNPKISAIAALEEKGCIVELYSGDLQDDEALSRYFEKIRKSFGEIKGVIHSAAASPKEGGETAFIKKDLKEFRTIYEAKVNGFENLQKIFNKDPLDFFVSFSSPAGQIPYFMRGLSSYGMANSYLDYATNYQVFKGRPAFRTIAWVGWTDAGMHTRNNSLEATQRYTRKLGLLFNNSKEGIELFEKALTVDCQYHNILPCFLDETSYNASSTHFYTAANGNNPIYSKIKAFENGQLSKQQFASFLKTLSDSDYTESIQQEIVRVLREPLPQEENSVEKSLSDHILDELERVLKIKKSSFDWDQSFQNYGLDSISGIQLATLLEKKFNFPVQPRWFIEYSTLNLLKNKLSQETKTKITTK